MKLLGFETAGKYLNILDLKATRDLDIRESTERRITFQTYYAV